jgi:hypothetical protein
MFKAPVMQANSKRQAPSTNLVTLSEAKSLLKGNFKSVWLEFIWNLGFGDWDLANNIYSAVGCKIENDITH